MKKPSNVNNQSTAQAFFVGKQARMLKNCVFNSGLKKGDTFTISRVNYGNPIYIYTTSNSSLYTNLSCIELVPLDKAELKKQIEKHKESIAEIKSKIKYLDENGIDEFDSDEFKVFKTLEVIEKATSKIQKAREIAKLIKNN